MRGILFAFAFCVAVNGRVAASDLYGPLRERDLTTFGISRLDIRPAHAMTMAPGSWAIEAALGYQNTWSLTPEVRHHLQSFGRDGRHRLGANDVAELEALPRESYLADSELAAFDITLHYQLSRIWSGYLIASGLSTQGGFLDGLIEDFHSFFGFPSYGRDGVRRNDINNVFLLKSGRSVELSVPSRMGMTDPTVAFRYTGIRMPRHWQLVLEGAAKIPLRSRDPLLSTGRFDYGAQASLQYIGARQGIYLSIAGVYYAGLGGPIRQESQLIPTAIIGYERKLTARTNIVAQMYASNSVFSKRQTDLEELTAKKYQLSLGIRHRRAHCIYTFGITENVHNMNNTPDLGFQLSLLYIP